jgi:hypothetical protein
MQGVLDLCSLHTLDRIGVVALNTCEIGAGLIFKRSVLPPSLCTCRLNTGFADHDKYALRECDMHEFSLRLSTDSVTFYITCLSVIAKIKI